jgi:hypothetical protein
MPTPSSRTPVRVARGTYSNLNSSVTDIQEGEICYATDQNKLYVKEGSSLESTQADVAAKANTASPTFTGTPAGPTASTSTNTTQLATTAFVQQEITANAGPGLDDENTWTKGQRGEITTLTNSSGTVAIDFDASNNFYLSLGANVTTITFSNITAGQSGSIFINQTGTYTVGGWPGTAKFSGGTAPTITATAGKYDRIDYAVYDGSNVHLVWTGNY